MDNFERIKPVSASTKTIAKISVISKLVMIIESWQRNQHRNMARAGGGIIKQAALDGSQLSGM